MLQSWASIHHARPAACETCNFSCCLQGHLHKQLLLSRRYITMPCSILSSSSSAHLLYPLNFQAVVPVGLVVSLVRGVTRLAGSVVAGTISPILCLVLLLAEPAAGLAGLVVSLVLGLHMHVDAELRSRCWVEGHGS